MEINGEKVDWTFGEEYARNLLQDIHDVAHRSAPYKIETGDYSIYWAGSVLRVDIKHWTEK